MTPATGAGRRINWIFFPKPRSARAIFHDFPTRVAVPTERWNITKWDAPYVVFAIFGNSGPHGPRKRSERGRYRFLPPRNPSETSFTPSEGSGYISSLGQKQIKPEVFAPDARLLHNTGTLARCGRAFFGVASVRWERFGGGKGVFNTRDN